MRHPSTIKICGLKTIATLDAALAAGADMLGFVFFAKSPRHLDYDAARTLAACVRGRAQKVALVVDADDAALADIIAAAQPDLLQLHGHETPARCAEIKERFGVPVMKALAIAARADLNATALYEEFSDRLLFDAKPPADARHPGGNGLAFDWQLLSGLSLGKPYMLSGGLDPDNVAAAIAQTHAPGVDVSSGVESAPGVKNEEKISQFVARARAAYAALAARPAGVKA